MKRLAANFEIGKDSLEDHVDDDWFRCSTTATTEENKSVVTNLDEFGFTTVDYPPYSPDMAPSDYFLFPNMKKSLGWSALSVV